MLHARSLANGSTDMKHEFDIRARMHAATAFLVLFTTACGEGGDQPMAPPPAADEGEGVVGAWVRSGGRVGVL